MPQNPVTLQEVKTHCRIDFNDDDNLLQHYIAAATQWAEKFLNVDFTTIDTLADTWRQAILLTVADWYENRVPPVKNKPIPTTAEYLLWPDRNVPV